jgi:hypothetical protein
MKKFAIVDSWKAEALPKVANRFEEIDTEAKILWTVIANNSRVVKKKTQKTLPWVGHRAAPYKPKTNLTPEEAATYISFRMYDQF